MEHRWGMSIDLDRCTGCEACVVGVPRRKQPAAFEPGSGREGPHRALDSRGPLLRRRIPGCESEVRPVLCQQCDNAPCEPVCPTYATYHNPEGLNVQVYNRCVGTFYCANNCPYTVRFFNWFAPEWPEPLQLQHNPDVAIRPAGVMEKCTFCIQRIQRGKRDAAAENRPCRRRDSARLRAILPRGSDGVRRSERSRKQSVAAGRKRRARRAPGRTRHKAQSILPGEGRSRAWRRPHPSHCRTQKSASDLFRPLSRSELTLSGLRSSPLLIRCVILGAWWRGAIQLRDGMGVTGINRPVFWGFYIVDFVFWIGISHAGTLISAILRLTDAGWRKPMTRAAEAITRILL